MTNIVFRARLSCHNRAFNFGWPSWPRLRRVFQVWLWHKYEITGLGIRIGRFSAGLTIDENDGERLA